VLGSLTRACLLVLVAAVSVSASGGQPAEDQKDERKPERFRPSYTAFPDIKSPAIGLQELKRDQGNDDKNAVPLPPWPTVAANAPQLRKIQFEQLQESRDYLERVKEVLRIGSYNFQFIRDYVNMTVEVYRLAAELEEKPAKRVPWYEARVRKLKELERSVELRVEQGTEPPQGLPLARFHRLQAEIDLTKLKAEVEKAGGK
jgi:hypothetical protein